jgi:hypothetical protein
LARCSRRGEGPRQADQDGEALRHRCARESGLPKGRFTVSITATASDGRTVTGKRTYNTCARKRGSPGPKL